MTDHDLTLRTQLRRIDGDGPSVEFTETLRRNLQDAAAGSVPKQATLIDLRPPAPLDAADGPTPASHTPGRPGRWLLSAAAVLVVGALLALAATERPRGEVGVASTTPISQLGEAWLASIVEGDLETFASLHGPDLTVDDTLMGFSEDVDILTPARIGELYYGGFEALQAAIAIDGDTITSNGCDPISQRRIRCAFTATMIGTADYTYTVIADLTVDAQLIVSIDFSTKTEPADFRDQVQGFLDTEATADDRACLALGFNTAGCGEHESDFIGRYAAYYEANRSPADG